MPERLSNDGLVIPVWAFDAETPLSYGLFRPSTPTSFAALLSSHDLPLKDNSHGELEPRWQLTSEFTLDDESTRMAAFLTSDADTETTIEDLAAIAAKAQSTLTINSLECQQHSLFQQSSTMDHERGKFYSRRICRTRLQQTQSPSSPAPLEVCPGHRKTVGQNSSRRRQKCHRSKSGCWTCRLRHKACPEDGVPCSTCIRLHLKCDANVERPAYMTDKKLAAAYFERMRMARGGRKKLRARRSSCRTRIQSVDNHRSKIYAPVGRVQFPQLRLLHGASSSN